MNICWSALNQVFDLGGGMMRELTMEEIDTVHGAGAVEDGFAGVGAWAGAELGAEWGLALGGPGGALIGGAIGAFGGAMLGGYDGSRIEQYL
jgi:hypothetical protein